MIRRHILAAALAPLLASLFLSSAARAGDDHHLRFGGGASASATTWRGDAAGYTGLNLGFRFVDLIGPVGSFQVGYGVVDDRMLTLLTLGAQVWLPELGPVRPYGRLAFLHQHEESLAVVADDFGSALFGIGDGIRHRAGGELGIGADMGLWEDDDWQLYGALDGSFKLFPDDLGPMLYGGAGLNLGMSYTL
jgi:hypothetical protein